MVSIGFNVFLLWRKQQRMKHDLEVQALYTYKSISYEYGLNHFIDQFKKKYPEVDSEQKHFIVYRWDSLSYEFIYREQMLVLDSMAASFGNPKLDYVFVTEMEEKASEAFLKRNGDSFANVKMLFGMDDYISGLHNNKDLKIIKPIVMGAPTGDLDHNFKQKSLYVLMNENGKVLHFNEKKCMILKDTAFFEKLKVVVADKSIQVLNWWNKK